MKDYKTVPDLVMVSTVSRKGQYSKPMSRGAAYFTVTKGFNAKTSQIAVEGTYTSGTGVFKKETQHEHALINITFEDGQIWSGTFQDLQNQLK